jgi:ATP-dependent Clp protease ATP-binding subunit ClpB
VVDEESIAKIVAKMTGIPVSKIEKGDREKVLDLRAILEKRVIGQDEAIRLGLECHSPATGGDSKPQPADWLLLVFRADGRGQNRGRESLGRGPLRQREQHHPHRYVGVYGKVLGVASDRRTSGLRRLRRRGQLTEKVRRNPYSIVLFDEIEKADPEVFNLLLQLLDEGRLTDSQGRLVDFKNTIIIMTSNIGSEFLLEGNRAPVEELLHKTFKPEFLNRIDEIVYFNPLSKEVQRKIVDKMLNELNARLQENFYSFSFSDKLKDYILDAAYSPFYGARPLKRFIQDQVETVLAEAIVKGEVNTTDKYLVDVSPKGEIIFHKDDSAKA